MSEKLSRWLFFGLVALTLGLGALYACSSDDDGIPRSDASTGRDSAGFVDAISSDQGGPADRGVNDQAPAVDRGPDQTPSDQGAADLPATDTTEQDAADDGTTDATDV